MSTIEHSVILLYGRMLASTDMNKAKSSTHGENNVQVMPPTKAVLVENMKRAIYQRGHTWGKYCCLHQYCLPLEAGTGNQEARREEPHWTSL